MESSYNIFILSVMGSMSAWKSDRWFSILSCTAVGMCYSLTYSYVKVAYVRTEFFNAQCLREFPDFIPSIKNTRKAIGWV
jgi:hypothetical protein